MRTKRFIIAAVISVLALPALASAQGRAVPRGGGHVAPGPGPGHPGGGGPVAVPRGTTYRPPYYPYYPNRYPYYGYRPYYGYPYYGYPGYGYGYPGWSFSLYYGYPWYGPYGFSVGVGYGYPYYGYGYPGYAAAPYYGGVRLVVPQRNAEVYVDGYYAGVVNDFDGTFQQVNLEPGPHRIEVRGQGATPLSFDVNVQPGRTVTYRAPAPREAQP